MRRVLLLLIVAFVGFLAVPAQASTQGVTIEKDSFKFAPASITIHVGDSVQFLSKDNRPHTATADDGAFDTSPTCVSESDPTDDCLKKDEPVTVDFDTPGTFAYHCKIHSSMHGTVVVQSDATTSSTTSTTKPSTTTTSSTTTSTSSTTTTSSSTTSTTLATASGSVAIADSGGKGGGSSALPLVVGAVIVLAAIGGLVYWRWSQNQGPYDEGPDWTQEPPTMQGPRI